MARDARHIVVLGTGGTIASVSVDASTLGVHPLVPASDLAASIGGVPDGLSIASVDVFRKASPSIGLPEVLRVRDAAEAAIRAGAQGVVVTHGTSTLEESAYALSLLWDRPEPIVVTGAMRNPSLAGADGPANVRAAVFVAASLAAEGVLVVFDGEIWLPRHLRKTHTNSTSPFESRQTGRIGWVSEDDVDIVLRPEGRQSLVLHEIDEVPEVPLLVPAFGDPGTVIDLVEKAPAIAGLVVEGMGPGHVPESWVEPLARLVARVPVVIASRTGAGLVYRRSYGFPGSDVDLAEHGLLSSGVLDARKARILLQLLLAADARGDVQGAFTALSGTADARYPHHAEEGHS